MELWQLMNTYGQQNPNPQNTTTPSSYSQANPQQYAYPSYPSYPTSNYPNQPAYNYADYYSSQQMQYPSQTPAYSYYDPFQYPNQPYYQQMPPQPQYNNRNRYPPNRNNKPKSEPKPVQTFRCEDCDKTYNNEEFYQRHMAGHTRCPVEGCQFIGSSSALSVHQLRQHNPRFRDAFKLLESPEGLQKYLEERKKNFPTKDAVNKKQEDLQRKIQRGEVVLQTKRFRDKRGRWQTEKKYCVNKNYKPAENAENTVAMTTPTVPLEEGELPEEASSKVDPNQELVVIEEQEKDKKERKKKLCKHFKKGHCDRGDSCMFLHDESLINVKRKREDQSQQMSKKPTLLEKLLSKDILEEKSVVLQCLRFIVQNKFFENPVATSV